MITAQQLYERLPKVNCYSVIRISYLRKKSSAAQELQTDVNMWFYDIQKNPQSLKDFPWPFVGSYLEGSYALDGSEDWKLQSRLIEIREWEKADRARSRCPYHRWGTTIRKTKAYRTENGNIVYIPTLAQLKLAEQDYRKRILNE